ncbi:MAG: geranylgeranylglycerol-phosphate geranylgeranyltransferase [Sulfolobales archaeon]|nr:geranylgeranylglycerol-phosphate geranylgeranyltransferase [Ignisphaera sp.]MCX8199797.1 geranylgeranylglycerol-phosphate geranylgeranyltransferase [Sulfolobales archaeon]MDW8084964.1 geranylgeranylglycerol-phosphate geranylgeranyltransferase [Ignisphaera sp.]
MASIINTVKAWLSIARIGNDIALGIATIIGHVLGGGTHLLDMAIAFTVGLLLGAGGNIINDYFDRHVDAINKPWRPIPSGLISATMAYRVSMLLFVVGILLAFYLSYINGFIAFVAALLVYLYSYRLKSVLLLGNLIVAFLVSLSIIFGGVSSTLNVDVLIASLFAFLLNVGREFLKGIEDVEGDMVMNVRTLATVYSPFKAYIAALIIFAALIILSFIPYLLFNYSIVYLTLAIGVDTIILFSLYRARDLSSDSALRATRLLKISVFLGLFAFLFNKLISFYT